MVSFVPHLSLRHSFGKRVTVCAPVSRAHVVPRRAYHVQAKLDEADYTETVSLDPTMVPEVEALDESSGSVIVPASYALPGAFLTVAIAMRWLEVPAVWIPCAVLAVFLSVQASVVRFIFGPKRFSVAKKGLNGLQIIRGWRYDEFANWEVWWPNAPVLCFLRERESYGGKGSYHFFPLICDSFMLQSLFRERAPGVKK